MPISCPFFSVIDIFEYARTVDFSSGVVERSTFESLSPGEEDHLKLGAYAIGRYLEDRPGMYTAGQYQAIEAGRKSARTVHMGMDFFAPAGTPVRSFWNGRIHDFKYRGNALDYGYTLIMEYDLPSEQKLYALYGHLGSESLKGKKRGQQIAAGEVIGLVGSSDENGGWEIPHLHFQLSWAAPVDCDFPGVVALEDLWWARLLFPDPDLVCSVSLITQ